MALTQTVSALPFGDMGPLQRLQHRHPSIIRIREPGQMSACLEKLQLQQQVLLHVPGRQDACDQPQDLNTLTFSTAGLPVPEPSYAVVTRLTALSPFNGSKLLQQIVEAVKVFLDGAEHSTGTGINRFMSDELRSIHATLVEVDDDLMPSNLSHEDHAAAEQCTQWLKQLQSYVMALQRDLDSFTQPGQDVALAELWPGFLQSTARSMQQLLEAITMARSQFESEEAVAHVHVSVSAAPVTPAVKHSGTKLVVTRSRLRYKSCWAGKPSL